MPQVTISEDVYARVLAFKPLFESALDVRLENESYIELLLRSMPDLFMNEFFAQIEGKGFLRLLQQMGQIQPQIYGIMADILERDEQKMMEAERRAEVKQQLGFPEPAERNIQGVQNVT